MKRFIPGKNFALICLFSFVVIAMAAILVFYNAAIENPEEAVRHSEPKQSLGRFSSALSSYPVNEQKADGAYNKRNAEIDSWIEDDVIQDYNNASLLYYQALLFKPDHDKAVINKFYNIYGGAEPDTQIRKLLGEWLPSMKVSEIASRIPQCNWGIWP